MEEGSKESGYQARYINLWFIQDTSIMAEEGERKSVKLGSKRRKEKRSVRKKKNI